MKNSMFIRGIAPLAVCALFAPTAVNAQPTSFTATGWVNAVFAPGGIAGIICTNALGQVLVRGPVHTARVQATDARVTGQVLIIGNAGYNANGTANWEGTACLQVGTWDAAGTNFTPTGGMWEATWRGVMQTDNSFQLSIAGYGSGGTIDGLRVEETLTRAAGPILDPTIPYLYTGTIKPAPVNTSVVLQDFDKPFTGWSLHFSPSGQGSFFTTNQQLTLRGYYTTPTCSMMDSFVDFGTNGNWTVPNGMTFEWRADLVSLNDSATNNPFLLVGSDSGFYGLLKGRDFVYLYKWPGPNGGFGILAGGKAQVRNTNVVLALALTRVSSSIALTGRVLDKADPTSVLGQCSAMDTPNVDATLNTDQLQALTGMNLLLDADIGAPFTSFAVYLGAGQDTDGHQPAVLATFDNLELRTSEIPPLGIEHAVRLTWPATGMNYAVEAASSVQGPYLPFQDLATPGVNQMTVPVSDLMRFFRLQQAP